MALIVAAAEIGMAALYLADAVVGMAPLVV
jgi:hypothetical protein